LRRLSRNGGVAIGLHASDNGSGKTVHAALMDRKVIE
jgi:hypothetical protein